MILIIICTLLISTQDSWAAIGNNNIANELKLSYFNPENIFSTKVNSSPSGIRVYIDNGPLDCNGENMPPEVGLPFSEGGTMHGDQDNFFGYVLMVLMCT